MEIYTSTWDMESALLGPPSDLPPLRIDRHLADEVPVDEGVLTDLWDEVQALRGTGTPAPPEIDFRMR